MTFASSNAILLKPSGKHGHDVPMIDAGPRQPAAIAEVSLCAARKLFSLRPCRQHLVQQSENAFPHSWSKLVDGTVAAKSRLSNGARGADRTILVIPDKSFRQTGHGVFVAAIDPQQWLGAQRSAAISL